MIGGTTRERTGSTPPPPGAPPGDAHLGAPRWPDVAWEPTHGLRLSLGGSEVHVWCVDLAEVRHRALLDGYRDFLPEEERRHLASSPLEPVRLQRLTARVLVRTVLSRYAGRAPREWEFERLASGRLVLAPGSGVPWLRFGLSHTNSGVVLLVARDREAGIDIEDVGRVLPAASLAAHCFAPEETAALRETPGPQRMRRFMELWTLKESYAKARGLALSQVLDGAVFDVAARSVRASFDPRLRDSPGRWLFALHETASHVVGITVERGDEAAPAIRVRRTVPLA